MIHDANLTCATSAERGMRVFWTLAFAFLFFLRTLLIMLFL